MEGPSFSSIAQYLPTSTPQAYIDCFLFCVFGWGDIGLNTIFNLIRNKYSIIFTFLGVVEMGSSLMKLVECAHDGSDAKDYRVVLYGRNKEK